MALQVLLLLQRRCDVCCQPSPRRIQYSCSCPTLPVARSPTFALSAWIAAFAVAPGAGIVGAVVELLRVRRAVVELLLVFDLASCSQPLAAACCFCLLLAIY